MTFVSSAATASALIQSPDLFGGITMPSTSIVGLMVVLEERPACACGSFEATIGASAGPHCASLLCAYCQRHRGWLSAETFSFVTEIADLFGRPKAIRVTSK